jgi:hypothetical protein
MKKIIDMKGYIIPVLFSLLSFFSGCKDDEKLESAPRLFTPLVKLTIGSSDPYIAASWTNITGATSFTAEISKDSFKTVLKSVEVDTTYYTFNDLAWDESYQVRVKCNGNGIESGYYAVAGLDLDYPTFLKNLTSSDITDVGVRPNWTKNDSTYTTIKVYQVSDNSLIKEVSITAADTTAKYAEIYGLAPSTSYKLVAYSNGRYQGIKRFTTVASQIFDIPVDLRNEADNVAKNMLTQAYLQGLAPGSTVILKRGLSYAITGTVLFNQSITITSGLGFGSNLAVLNLTAGNFDVAAGASIDLIKFIDLTLKEDNGSDLANGKYILNISTTSPIVSKIVASGCQISALRGVVRNKSTTAAVDSVIFNNCIIDSIGSYGIIAVDAATTGSIKNIKITNSTISDAQKFLVNTKTATNSVYLENCTFCYIPMGSSTVNYFMDFNGMNIASVTIKSCIFGPAKTSAGVSTVNGYRAKTINFTTAGNYKTSDLTWFLSTTAIPDLTDYTGLATALFTDPANDDFTIKDKTFTGKATAGDPRWRLK